MTITLLQQIPFRITYFKKWKRDLSEMEYCKCVAAVLCLYLCHRSSEALLLHSTLKWTDSYFQ